MYDILLLLLAAGLPYYIILEKINVLSSRSIFLLSMVLLFSGIIASLYITNEHTVELVVIAFASALYTIYRAVKTTNLYRLGYYLIYVNAPFFLLFEEKGSLYSASLLVSLVGLYLIASFYEKNYGSANYHSVRGITLTTPCVGTYLTLYLVAISLYPPFPNSLFFLNYIFNSSTAMSSYIVVITLFMANFYLAMRVMKSTLFGQRNPNIHYVHMTAKEKTIHAFVVVMLLILSIYALGEMLL